MNPGLSVYPAELTAYLQARGLTLIEDTGSVEYRARHLGPRGRHLKGYEFYGIALAHIELPPTKSIRKQGSHSIPSFTAFISHYSGPMPADRRTQLTDRT